MRSLVYVSLTEAVVIGEERILIQKTPHWVGLWENLWCIFLMIDVGRPNSLGPVPPWASGLGYYKKAVRASQ